MSEARFSNVRSSVMSSRRALGTLWLRVSITACITARPLARLGFAVGSDGALADRPGGFDFDVGIAGEQRMQPGFFVCR